MLTIKPRSWHYRLYRTLYWGCESRFWDRTIWPAWVNYLNNAVATDRKNKPYLPPKDLCSYFWALVFAPLMALSFSGLLLLSWAGQVVIGYFIIAIVKALAQLIRWAWRRGKPTTIVHKEPSLTWEFVKAKKRRVCPPIQIQEEVRDG